MIKYGALEAGGTKMACAIVDENGTILEKESFPTTNPLETLPKILGFFKDKEIVSLGIACFGPVDLDETSATYGYILNTPKIKWKNCDIVGYFSKNLGLPIGFDTDVNGSMIGEATFGAAKDVKHAAYITIGTGIGIGVMIDGKLHHGMLHPEGGHILLTKRKEDTYAGHCPFHASCFEGLASGPAIEERFGMNAKLLAGNEKVWELEADYIAQAIMNYVLILSPQRIILGGGVMHQRQLFPLIRKRFNELLAQYISTEKLKDIDHYISETGLNDDQGMIGAAMLGKLALERNA